MAGILTRDSAHLIQTWLGPSSQALFLRIIAFIINRYYYGFWIIMSINKTTHSPLALREGFHVVLLRALAERLQGRDWVLKGGTNLRLYFGSIRFSEDVDLDVGKDVAGAMQRAIPATLADGDVQRRLQTLGSDTVLAYLDPAQRQQLQDEDTWIARQLFVGDLIDQILAVPPETIT